MHEDLSGLTVGLLCLLAVTGTAVGQSAGVALTATGGDARAGGTATVTFTAENTGAEAVPVIVNVTGLPAGWGIENHSDDGGNWNDGDRKWLFLSVSPGGTVTPTLTLSVPANASGSYDVVAAADDGDATIESTATVPVSDGSAGATESAADGTEKATTGGDGPGFGVVGTVAALVGVTLLARRRR